MAKFIRISTKDGGEVFVPQDDIAALSHELGKDYFVHTKSGLSFNISYSDYNELRTRLCAGRRK